MRINNTLHRYILYEVFRPFIGSLAFFIFIALVFQLIRFSDFLLVHHGDFGSFFRLLLYLTIYLLPTTVPISFFLAVLIGCGRLSGYSEVTALRASGMSLFQFMTPIIALGFFISLCSLVLNLHFVPWGDRMFRQEIIEIGRKKIATNIRTERFTRNFFNMVLYADDVNKEGTVLKKLFITDESIKSSPMTIVAKEGIFLNSGNQGGEDGDLILRLKNGSLHRSRKQGYYNELIQFSTYDILLKITTSEIMSLNKPKSMDHELLVKKINKLEKNPKKTKGNQKSIRRLKVEFWKRYALSGSCLVFAFMGVGFGIVRTRSVRTSSLLISLIFLMGYWILSRLGLYWGENNILSPFLSIWLPNFLLLGVSVFSLRGVWNK